MISIVIPAYNEEENIPLAKAAIFSALKGEPAEIVFVDDGSKDLTWQKICEESGENVRGIRFSRNFGKEAAIRAGLEAASGEAAVVIDCDLQHPPETINEMLKKWRGGAKVVAGKKSSRGKEAKSYGLSSKIFNALMSRSTGFDMTGASDFMLLDRQAIDAVLSYKEQGSFFRALAQFVGFSYAEVEYHVAAREHGSGKWTFKKLCAYAAKNIAAFSYLPLYLSVFAGAVASAAGLCLLVLTAAGLNLGSFGGGAAALILLCGLILCALGVIGFYLSRIYDEVKRRPKYIISDDTEKKGFEK